MGRRSTPPPPGRRSSGCSRWGSDLRRSSGASSRTRPRSALRIRARSSSILAGRNRSFWRRSRPISERRSSTWPRLKAHEVDGDWGHAWAQTSSEGLGTGPYRITEFDIETGVVLERNAGYWRGWEGDHFDRVILRVVAEPETRRALIENGDADIAAVLPLATVRELERVLGSGRRPAIQPDRPLHGDDRRRAARVTRSAPGPVLGLPLRRGHRRRLRGVRQAGDRPGRRAVPRLRSGHVCLSRRTWSERARSCRTQGWRREPR